MPETSDLVYSLDFDSSILRTMFKGKLALVSGKGASLVCDAYIVCCLYLFSLLVFSFCVFTYLCPVISAAEQLTGMKFCTVVCSCLGCIFSLFRVYTPKGFQVPNPKTGSSQNLSLGKPIDCNYLEMVNCNHLEMVNRNVSRHWGHKITTTGLSKNVRLMWPSIILRFWLFFEYSQL